MEQRLDRLESMATEQQETNTELRNLMKQVLDATTTIGKESKSDSSLTHEKLGNLEKRVITLESGNTAKGDCSFKEQHKSAISKAKRSIKILNMREVVTEENLK